MNRTVGPSRWGIFSANIVLRAVERKLSCIEFVALGATLRSDSSLQPFGMNENFLLCCVHPRLRPNLFANCSFSGCIQFFRTDRIKMIWNSRGKYSGAFIGPIKSGSYSDILFSFCWLTQRQLKGYQGSNRKKVSVATKSIWGKIQQKCFADDEILVTT